MDKNEKNSRDYYVVDLAHIVKVVWKRIWAVVAVSLITAIMGFVMAKFVIKPSYSASIMLYVNNSSFNVGDLAFAFCPGEPSDTVGKAVKKNSPFKTTFFCGYSNGTGHGYMPTIKAFEHGGYGCDTCRFPAGTTERLASEMLGMICDLKAKQKEIV